MWMRRLISWKHFQRTAIGTSFMDYIKPRVVASSVAERALQKVVVVYVSGTSATSKTSVVTSTF